MTFRNLVLCSAAAVAFGAMALSAVPSHAHHPEEFASTEEHARAHGPASEQTTVTITSGPAASYAKAVEQHNQALAAYHAAQARYQEQLRDYQARYGAYAQRQQAFRADVEADRDELADYPYGDVPDAVVVFNRSRLADPDEYEALIELDALADATIEIGGAPVRDRFGNVVGSFRYMTFQDEGWPKAAIMLHNNKMIVIDSERLRYDPDADIVVADLSFDELNRFPARF